MVVDRKVWTCIALKRKTAKSIKELKLSGHESYDEIINRLIDHMEANIYKTAQEAEHGRDAVQESRE